MLALSLHTLLVAFGLLAFTPLRLADLRSRPAPVADYATAAARVQGIQAIEDSLVAPGGGTILLTHGQRTARVFVLFHGFSDSPLQFEPFGKQLFEGGDNVYIPRIPRHAEKAGTVKSMGKLSVLELREFGDNAIDVASALGDTVVAVGLSAGANVAAWAAQYRPEVKRVVLVAPALAVPKVPSMFRGAVLRTVLRMPNVRRSSARLEEEPDKIPGWATHALAQILILGDVVRSSAHSSAPRTVEAGFLLSGSDRTVPNSAAFELARAWREHHVRVEVFEFPDTLHLPHDVIDPRQPRSDTALVYPVLAALTKGVPTRRLSGGM